jgi:hypothetical protein
MLAALAAGFGGAFAVLGEIAAAAAMTALLAVVAILGLLLPIAVVGVLAALLAGLDMLFVGSALVGHSSSPVVAPRDRETAEGAGRSFT